MRALEGEVENGPASVNSKEVARRVADQGDIRLGKDVVRPTADAMRQTINCCPGLVQE